MTHIDTILTGIVRTIGATLALLAGLFALTASTPGGTLSAAEIGLVALAVGIITTIGGAAAVRVIESLRTERRSERDPLEG